MPRYWKPVVAKKSYNGVTIGYVVGWKALYSGQVRNIRANLIFKTVIKARRFASQMESGRINPWPEFEIVEDE